MNIYIIRHGKTEENKQKRIMGRSPGNLSSEGKEQARKTGLALSEEGINLVYTSPLDRCVETTKIINEHIQREIVEEVLLIERDFGQLTGALHKNVNFKLIDSPSEKNKKLGVESLLDVKKRIEAFLSRVEKVENKNILIVTHNNPIRMILAVLLNKAYSQILKEHEIHNCGITVFSVNKREQTPVRIDDVNHLK